MNIYEETFLEGYYDAINDVAVTDVFKDFEDKYGKDDTTELTTFKDMHQKDAFPPHGKDRANLFKAVHERDKNIGVESKVFNSRNYLKESLVGDIADSYIKAGDVVTKAANKFKRKDSKPKDPNKKSAIDKITDKAVGPVTDRIVNHAVKKSEKKKGHAPRPEVVDRYRGIINDKTKRTAKGVAAVSAASTACVGPTAPLFHAVPIGAGIGKNVGGKVKRALNNRNKGNTSKQPLKKAMAEAYLEGYYDGLNEE